MKAYASAALAAVLGLASTMVPAAAQAPAAQTASASPAARPADVASVDAVMAALYDVISGDAGAPRDWDRLRSLFAPSGKMGSVAAGKEGGYELRSMTVEEYIARTRPFFAQTGFHEIELARTTESFGQLVHVFSSYETRRAAGDAKPMQRGINSIQLYHDGSRWWINSIVWRAEDDSLALPERYLKSR